MNETAVKNIVGAGIYALLNEDGFTITASTGKSYEGHHWLVGGIIPSLTITDQVSAQEFHQRVEEWYKGAEALDGDHALIGGWVHDGTLYLDLVSLVEDDEQAKLLGKLWSQIAIARRDENNEVIITNIEE